MRHKTRNDIRNFRLNYLKMSQEQLATAINIPLPTLEMVEAQDKSVIPIEFSICYEIWQLARQKQIPAD